MISTNSAPHFVSYEDAISQLDWPGAVQALRLGHNLPRAEIKDAFLGPATGTMMSRSAYIEGLGYGGKVFTVFDANAARGLPTVQGAMMVFDREDGRLQVIVESRLVTEFKTAADSVLGALLLARPDSRHLLIVGAGTVAASLAKAYTAVLPGIERVSIWARRQEQAQALVSSLDIGIDVDAVSDLQAAVGQADIVTSATMARQPIIFGDWVRPGTHVDLIGAYKADMREVDDALVARASLFVDSRATTLGHIGELIMPIAAGVITAESVRGDFYDLVRPDVRRRQSDKEITLFKNGGGAHLDLMIASWIARVMTA